MNETRRCNRCQRSMKKTKDKIPGVLVCESCQVAWMSGKGYFTLDPGAEFYLEEVTIRGETAYIPRVKMPSGNEVADTPPKGQEPRWKKQQEAGTSYQRTAQQLIRGGIYFVDKVMTDGHEQHTGRPAVVVSDVTASDSSFVVTIVPLTSRDKPLTKTRTVVRTSGVKAVALCDQIDTVDCRKIGDYMGQASPAEMSAIKQCLSRHLGHVSSAAIMSGDNEGNAYISQLEAKIRALEAQLAEQTAIAKRVIVRAIKTRKKSEK